MAKVNMEKFIDGLHKWAAEKIYGPLLKKITALESEVQALKHEKSSLRYMGVFQRAITYHRGNIVTHDGSAWIKISDSKDGAPGACESWQLMVKRGKDA
jgi:hypothetical protein